MDKIFVWIKTHLIMALMIIIIIVPVLVYFLSVLPLFPSGDNNDWAGFWGGYIGSIIGGVISVYVMKIPLHEEKKKLEYERKLAFCEEMIEAIGEIDVLAAEVHSSAKKFLQNGKESTLNEYLRIDNKLKRKILSTRIKLKANPEKLNMCQCLHEHIKSVEKICSEFDISTCDYIDDNETNKEAIDLFIASFSEKLVQCNNVIDRLISVCENTEKILLDFFQENVCTK